MMEEAVPEVKEPWQMTRAEFVEANPQYPNPEVIHRSAVFGAVNRGEVIAPEVLSDYPDLAERYKEVPKPPTAKTIEHRGTEPEGIAIGDELGVRYEGIQVGYEELPTTMMFTDIYQTGSSFTGKTLEEATEKLSKTREAFAKPLAASVVDYDRRYTLEELREMAKQAGLSPSGSKKEIAARLIAKGLK